MLKNPLDISVHGYALRDVIDGVWNGASEAASSTLSWIDHNAPEAYDKIEPKVQQAARFAGNIMVQASNGVRHIGAQVIEHYRHEGRNHDR